MLWWEGHGFVLFPSKFDIYEDDLSYDRISDRHINRVVCTQIHSFERCAFVNAFVLNGEAQVHDMLPGNALHLVMRSGQGRIYSYMVHYEHVSDPSKRFSFIKTGYFQLSEISGYMFKATKLCVGPSRGQLIVHTLDQMAWHKSLLHTAPIIEQQDGTFKFGAPVLLDMSGMPLLFEMTSMDFDDGVGVLVVGTHSGEVCVRTFGNKLPVRCLKSDLPTLHGHSDFRVSMSYCSGSD